MQLKVVIVRILLVSLAGLTFASNNIFKFEQNFLEIFGNKEVKISKIKTNSHFESAIRTDSVSGDEQAQRQKISQSEKNDPPKCGYQVREESFCCVKIGAGLGQDSQVI